MKKVITAIFLFTLTVLVLTLSNCGLPQNPNIQTSTDLEDLKGERGEVGEKGRRGSRGSDGEDGEKGDRGDRGERGARGTSGAAGQTGRRGETGDTGRLGLPGWCPDLFDIWDWDDLDDASIDFSQDSGGSLHGKIDKSPINEGRKALRKYLLCHNDPTTITMINAENTWFSTGVTGGTNLSRQQLLTNIGNDILELLDVSDDHTDWVCNSNYYFKINKKNDGTTSRTELTVRLAGHIRCQ